MNLTRDEMAALSPAELKAHLLKEEETVFGVGFRRDKDGRPVEQGIGAPGRETAQHREQLAREAERRALMRQAG